MFRYRRRRSDPEEVLKPYHESVPLEIVYTSLPVLIVVFLFVISMRANDRVTAVAPDPSLTVRVEAFAWGWRFAYPDGAEVVSSPSSETTAGPVLMLPQGETVRFQLTSTDTIHAFWVPEFLYKKDAIPGRTFEFDVTPTEVGTFQGHCAEFCGLNHAYMNFSVRVVTPNEFDSWLAQQRAAAA